MSSGVARRRLSPAELSKWYIRTTFQPFSLSSLGSHRDLSLAPYCLSCIYGGNRPNRCLERAQVPPVCRWLPNFDHHVSKCSSQCRWPACALSSRRRRLDECEPTTPERQLSSGYNMDRFTTYEVQILSSTVGVVGSARDIGVVIDSPLLMADHVASVCCSAHYHLRQIRPTLQSLPRDAAKTCVHLQSPGLLASPTTYFNDCSLYRTQPPG